MEKDKTLEALFQAQKPQFADNGQFMARLTRRLDAVEYLKREQEALRGFLLALCCGNKDDADDLAQDTLVKAYISSTGYQDKGKFRSWLFKIAHNTFLSYMAGVRATEDIGQAADLEDEASADATFEHQSLYIALATLPPKERSAITLFYLNGYSLKEIAQITDTSEDAVKKQLSRGRDRLKEKLKIES